MKNEEEITKAMDYIKDQLPTAQGNETILLQGQFAALGWVLDKKEEEKK